jgi:uncharacterized phage-associated protein
MMAASAYAYGPLVGFQSEKAAQVAAKFVELSGGRMHKLKLIKLLYLFERESFRKRRRPAFYDEYYSLKDGPICSNALNGINGGLGGEWANYIHKDGRRDVFRVADAKYDRISNSDMDIITSLWKDFSEMTASQIRAWTHDNCPEYTEITKGRKPITVLQIAEALEIEDATSVEREIEEFRRLSSLVEY